MKLLDVIIAIAEKALANPDTFLRAGHNGPYHDPETRIRNYGHWLITFSKCYGWTGEEKFKNKAAECAGDLYSEEARPHGYSFYHREKKGKDSCNGLIGQAWTFEALAEATRLLDEPKYVKLAEDVFFMHPFDEGSGLWKRIEPTGEVLDFDPTFNHQLWFASCSALVGRQRRAEILQRVTCFLDKLDKNLTILSNGLLYHPIEFFVEKNIDQQFSAKKRFATVFINLLKALKHLRLPEKPRSRKAAEEAIRKKQTYKSVGYHAFNTYAFAMLRQHVPEHSFWKSGRCKSLVNYLMTNEFWSDLENNNYGYPYNPPGFEVPYSLLVLSDMEQPALISATRKWVGEQFKQCFNAQTFMMDRNTEDPVTHTARLYELTRMPEEVLKAVDIDI